MKQLKEELLHFIWRSGLLFNNSLTLTNGDSLHIESPGIYNEDAGPDFLQVKIVIQDTIWFGNMEMHVKSSDWYLHKHHLDKVYDNVVLHVVYHHDKKVLDTYGNEIPTLELYPLLPPLVLKRYEYLQKSKHKIPCEPLFKLPEEWRLHAWMDRLFVSRLEKKTSYFIQLLESTDNNWDQAFYLFTARYFGAKTNAIPFEWLAKKIPLSILGRHRNNPNQVLAICLGVAGFLQADDPLYPEYWFLKEKYGLESMLPEVWKFSRIRPGGFPDVRIRQFAYLLCHTPHLFSEIQSCTDLHSLNHIYSFKVGGKQFLSQSTIYHLWINSVFPALFVYGTQFRQSFWKENILSFYSEIAPEENKIIRLWDTLGIKANNAFDSQALIELKTTYCDKIKCLHCTIGQAILLNESGT